MDLPLSRATIDRRAQRRDDTAWLQAAWQDPGARVVVTDGRRALVDECDRLVLISSREAPEGERYLLGVEDGTAYFGVRAPLPEPPGAAGAAGNGSAGRGGAASTTRAGTPGSTDGIAGATGDRTGGTTRRRTGDDTASSSGGHIGSIATSAVRSAGLREVGALLSDREAGLLTHAIALARWHDTHGHCPQCGTPTEAHRAGHVRVCPADGTEHFPRVDPAVIMLVRDERERCLLARKPGWPQRRYSVLAGFVEPGESLEQAVTREVAEETGLAVQSPGYVASQPWPFPASLMLAFTARAAGTDIAVDGEEISDAGWFTRAELGYATETGTLLLPPAASIARGLIENWYGAPLPGD